VEGAVAQVQAVRLEQCAHGSLRHSTIRK